MFYLSCLGLDPDPTNRGVRLWMSNPYRIHQRICRAFDEPGRLLFRLEDRPRARLLVQSPGQPDWARAFEDFPGVLDAEPSFKVVEPRFLAGQVLRFRLRANPTVAREGKRHGLFREEDQVAWLERKGRDAGFAPVSLRLNGAIPQLSSRGAGKDRTRQVHLAVEFEGQLRVLDPDRFGEAQHAGIGPAKAYGFGLLAVAPA